MAWLLEGGVQVKTSGVSVFWKSSFMNFRASMVCLELMVTLRGTPDPATGMVLDLGLLQRSIEDVQKMLDHKLLNKVEALGPPTLENLSRYVWERVQHAGPIARVSIHRDSCNESCTYYGPQG